MILLNNVNLPLDTDFSSLKPIAARVIKMPLEKVLSAELYRKSVDARHKNDIKFCCSLLISVKGDESAVLKKNKNAQIYKSQEYTFKKTAVTPKNRPVVVGFGPAGMFAALTLSRAGLRPIIIERGARVEERKAAVESFFKGGKLDTETNVQFGEGGAGTFSDGKLNTGIKDYRCRAVLKEFVRFGASSKILIYAKPHIGTDVLINVVKNLREEIISLGGEVRFLNKLEDIDFLDGKLESITVNGEKILTDKLILATGHSARDVFELLKQKNIEMVKKPFSMGVRIEHLQADINKALYGDFAEHKALGAADYKLAVHLKNGRGVYTFCMCPGGEVVNASSEEGGLAVNGMSESRRDGKNANSAVLVSVEPEDFSEDDVLAGCYFQREIERAAYNIGGGAVPVTTVGEFLFGQSGDSKVEPTVKPNCIKADFSEIFPEFITDSLKEGILEFDKKIKGFADKSAVLTAPETRSSSPVRILRTENYQSKTYGGLYPTGEGAGYAGGIMSAAVDGIRVAEAVIESFL
ncbi:MAG: hypothetical protein E7561_04855 [Ruminococcaceae bacterium]|nr:hypothetical protein [Oscillospiraceae bacterium]